MQKKGPMWAGVLFLIAGAAWFVAAIAGGRTPLIGLGVAFLIIGMITIRKAREG
jgi:hypothetical protein